VRKRELVRQALSAIGLTAARWRLLPRQLYCFNYHRIGDPTSTEFNRNIFSCTAARFEDHVRCLKSRFEILSLNRLQDILDNGSAGRRPLALITFDDGYVDNYTLAFPILRRHQVPATFFLPTAFVGTSILPWWEEVHWLARQAVGSTIRLAGASQPFSLRPEDAERDIRRVADFVKSRRAPVEEKLEDLRAASGGRRPAAEGNRLFLRWDEVREMRAGGMDFGAHTHNHLVLAHLSLADQRDELSRSKKLLEGALNEPVTAVAYPVGSADAYTPQTCETARALGYRLGFNFRRRINPLPLVDPLDVNRLAVGGDIGSPALRSIACFPGLFAE
jgi:peptidoglycan/xylan/chitin deacetylase (PgdA/CDA1 family)